MLDLSAAQPHSKGDNKEQKENRYDLIDDKILRVEVEMVPCPNRPDDDDQQEQHGSEVGLSPVVGDQRESWMNVHRVVSFA